MLLVNILLFAVAILALVIQLFTPVIINIPAMAVCLITFIVAIWHFRRQKAAKKVPLLAALNMLFQMCFFIVSLGIFAVITLPNEHPEDSSSVVHGIRQILIANGIIDKPKNLSKPVESVVSPPVSETINAPDQGAVQITVEGESETKVATPEEK